MHDLVCVIMLIYLFLLPVVAESPIRKIGALFDEIDLADLGAPLGPDSYEFIISASHVPVRLDINRPDLINPASVRIHDMLQHDAFSSNNERR